MKNILVEGFAGFPAPVPARWAEGPAGLIPATFIGIVWNRIAHRRRFVRVMNPNLSRRLPLAALAAVLFAAALVPCAALASTVEPSREIGTSSAQNPTLGIPRWKGWVDPADANNLWACYAGGSSSATTLVHSMDGGLTWSTQPMTVASDGYLNYHASLFGNGGDLYFTFPRDDILVRRFAAPALSDGDRLPLETLPATSGRHRSSITVDGDGRVWVFTRLGDAPSENVRYHYSDDRGNTWTSGVAVSTGSANVRVGSMPYVDGRACLVLLHLNSSRGFEYYLWNGTSFEARPDHSIHAEDMGYQRAFAHNVLGGDTFHLVFGVGNELRHAWKTDQNGTGVWNEQVIDTHPTMDSMLWAPSLTVRGSEMWLFYSRWQNDAASAQIYARRLTDGSSLWEDEGQVSLDGLTYNTHPNTAFSVPANADYVPVFWTSGPNQDRIRFTRISGSGVPVLDVEPPSRVKDLQAVTQATSDQVVLQWTAPGDDADEGQATSYDMRYSTYPINEVTWDIAVPLVGEPVPALSGVVQSMAVTDLKAGETYLFGLKAVDDAGNDSSVSNVIWAKVGAISHASRVPHERLILGPNRPNPFNPRTRISFTLPGDGRARLAVYDAAGRRVANLLDEWRPEGTHGVDWNGQDRSGRAVASGTYYTRLEFENQVTTRAITLVR